MLGSNTAGSKEKNPWGGPVGCFAVTIAIAVDFLLTPPIHGATVDWALDYMRENYGAWTVWIGWYMWWLLVAVLMFMACNLLVIMTINIIKFVMMYVGSRF